MTFYYIMFGGMVLLAGIVTLLDWLGQRHERRRQNH